MSAEQLTTPDKKRPSSFFHCGPMSAFMALTATSFIGGCAMKFEGLVTPKDLQQNNTQEQQRENAEKEGAKERVRTAGSGLSGDIERAEKLEPLYHEEMAGGTLDVRLLTLEKNGKSFDLYNIHTVFQNSYPSQRMSLLMTDGTYAILNTYPMKGKEKSELRSNFLVEQGARIKIVSTGSPLLESGLLNFISDKKRGEQLESFTHEEGGMSRGIYVKDGYVFDKIVRSYDMHKDTTTAAAERGPEGGLSALVIGLDPGGLNI
jgi:hypothetical protein